MLATKCSAVCLLLVGLLLWGGATTRLLAQAPGGAAAADPAEPQEIPRRVAIRFLTDSDYPPFNYYDEDNLLTGFNVDIARAVCLELAAACDIQVRPWSELLPALQKGETDAVIASHAISANVLKFVDFTDRYYHTPARFAGKRGAGRIDATPEGLEGKKIAVAKGTAHEAYLRAFFRDSSIRAFDTPELARDALITGATDL
ncbi:MAG: transporter substrate-binding domain-containing protein, partial [Hyphomicrobiaceae bacterium]|nr:transporter substrate-binding domain-containing protein [Hyphomicrobiaceae bacterium]